MTSKYLKLFIFCLSLSCESGANRSNLLTENDKYLDHISHILKERATHIGDTIEKVKDQLIWTKNQWEKDIELDFNKGNFILDSSYQFHKSGTLSRIKPDSYSNIYLRRKVPITKDLRRFIILSERLDDYWRRNEKEMGFSAWKYTIEAKNGLFRCYPWLKLDTTFGADLDFRQFRVFTDIKKIGSKKNRIVCGNPTNDYGGLGLSMSCSIGIFVQNKLFSILGLDITIAKLFGRSIEYDILDGRTFFFLTDKEGNIFLKNEILTPEENPSWTNILKAKNILDIDAVKKERILNTSYHGAKKISVNPQTTLLIINIPHNNWYLGASVKL